MFFYILYIWHNVDFELNDDPSSHFLLAAYTDLVLPLMKKWPEGVDMQNDCKVTPRHLLQMIKQELLQEDKVGIV